MRVRVAVPDHLLDASTLDALLEAVTRAGARQIRAREAPDFRAMLQRGAIKWKPEQFADGEHFDLPALTARRRWGDCDDLGPWLAASLRASGEDPRARAVARRSGPNRWHVRTQLSDGSIVDPSRWAGMGKRASVSGEEPSIRALGAAPLAMPGDGAIAVKRGPKGVWWARCDLPWADSHVASVFPGMYPEHALMHAVQGALSCSDGCSPEHAEYADQVAADLLSPPRVGSIFGSIANLAKGAVSTALKGGPLGSALGVPNILDVAKGLGGGKGGGGGLGGLMDLAKGPLGGMAASLIPGGSMIHSLLSGGLGGALGGGGGGGGGDAPKHAQVALPGGGHLVAPAAAPAAGPIVIRF